MFRLHSAIAFNVQNADGGIANNNGFFLLMRSKTVQGRVLQALVVRSSQLTPTLIKEKKRIVSAGCCPDYCEDLESSATSVKVK